MSRVRPLREDPRSDDERLVALTATISPRPLARSGWRLVLADAERSRLGVGWLTLGAMAFAGLLATVHLRRAATVEPEVTPLSATTQLSRTAEDIVSLDSGSVRVSHAGQARALRLTTVEVALEIESGTFLAEVSERGTMVLVEEGEVRARDRRTSSSTTLRKGERGQWPAPSAPSPTDPTASECTPGRSECPTAQTRSLDAQVALFELALAQANRGEEDAAIDTWRSWLRQYPEGVLHPEARLALFRSLARQRRSDEARAAADDFLRACADDPRRTEVLRLREALPR